MVLWGALAIWVRAFVEPRKATRRSRKSRFAPSVPGGPAPAPLRTQAEHRVAHHPAPHPFAGQLRKDLPGSGGLSTALTYLGVPLPRPLRSAHASLAPLPPPSSPSPASRGPCIPGPVPLTSAVEKPAGLRASAPLRARLRAAWRGHCAPQRPREGATRGKRRPDAAPRLHLPAPAKNIPGSRSKSEKRPQRSGAPLPGLLLAGRRRGGELEGTRAPCSPPDPGPRVARAGVRRSSYALPRSPPGCLRKPLPTPSRGTRMEPRFPGWKRDHHRSGGRPRPTRVPDGWSLAPVQWPEMMILAI